MFASGGNRLSLCQFFLHQLAEKLLPRTLAGGKPAGDGIGHLTQCNGILHVWHLLSGILPSRKFHMLFYAAGKGDAV